MTNLFSMPLLLALVAFLVGWLTAKFSSYIGARAAGLEVPEHHRTIRALEASLRVAKKDAEIMTEKLSSSSEELETLNESVDQMEQTAQFRDEELEEMRRTVRDETAKVVALRRELTERAEETIRAKVIARDSETELSVLKAGASAMNDEVGRLQNEREELTNRLKALDPDLIGESSSEESSQDDAQAHQGIFDC